MGRRCCLHVTLAQFPLPVRLHHHQLQLLVPGGVADGKILHTENFPRLDTHNHPQVINKIINMIVLLQSSCSRIYCVRSEDYN